MTDAQKDIEQLVEALGSKDAMQRGTARAGLVESGADAVPALLDSLNSSQQHVRWESAKALAEIADPATAQQLVTALADEDTDVRWVVGTALIALGRDALKPVLTTLTRTDTEVPQGVYAGAHHVLHDLAQRDELASLLQPVLQAFAAAEPAIALPVASVEALKKVGS